MDTFFVGLHQPSDAKHFDVACVSVNRLRTRKRSIGSARILLDSGAFTELATHGRYRHSVREYADEVRRILTNGVADLICVVAQDFMCEPFMLAKTGMTIPDHQRLTIERYDALVAETLPVPVMPVLQGFAPEDYVRHLRAYGDRLTPGMWVGVGSVCKRNSSPESIMGVLLAIHAERPDLRLHGFGVKSTALDHAGVRALLWSADSMAWSYAARRQGGNPNDWREAARFAERIVEKLSKVGEWWQPPLLFAESGGGDA